MQNKRFKLCVLILFGIFIITGLKGQTIHEVLSATGDNASGSGGSVNYTIGQIAYNSNNGTSGSLMEGIQIPYEIIVVTGIEDKSMNLILSAYPNPTTTSMTLKVHNSDFRNLNYKLYNINGKLLINEPLLSTETKIQMNNVLPATYILKVSDGNREVKTFKIIKN